MATEDADLDELSLLFEAASSYVAAAAGSAGLSENVLLRFYGLYKQATSGPCSAPRPSFLDFKGRRKW